MMSVKPQLCQQNIKAAAVCKQMGKFQYKFLMAGWIWLILLQHSR